MYAYFLRYKSPICNFLLKLKTPYEFLYRIRAHLDSRDFMANMCSVLESKHMGSLETTMNCQCKSQHNSMAMIEILWYNTISHGQLRQHYLSYATSLWQIYLRLLWMCNQFFGVVNIKQFMMYSCHRPVTCDKVVMYEWTLTCTCTKSFWSFSVTFLVPSEK